MSLTAVTVDEAVLAIERIQGDPDWLTLTSSTQRRAVEDAREVLLSAWNELHGKDVIARLRRRNGRLCPACQLRTRTWTCEHCGVRPLADDPALSQEGRP